MRSIDSEQFGALFVGDAIRGSLVVSHDGTSSQRQSAADLTPTDWHGRDVHVVEYHAPSAAFIPHEHQKESLEALDRHGPRNGILELPTGSGKTETALLHMVKLLEDEPGTRFIWVSYGRTLVRQALARAVQRTHMFPRALRMSWLRSEDTKGRLLKDGDVFDELDILFLMRDDLTTVLRHSRSGNHSDTVLQRTIERHSAASRVLLVYDECHQLQAPTLRQEWLQFDKGVLGSGKARRRRFWLLGMSATPMPTSWEATRDFKKTIFRPTRKHPGRKPEYGAFVHHSVTQDELVDRGILCPFDLAHQESGVFDIPTRLLRRLSKTGRVHDLPEKPNEAEKLRWAVQFNKRVMCARPVLEHLANCLGDHLDVLGKTLVFAADIDSAQTLTTLLKQHPKVGDGKVSLVHSRLDEFEEELEDLGAPQAADTQQQIDAFLKRGHKPCVMVNVGMLTTGFDDPAIQTVMLARLTFSPNLFWQMLGRGTRGPRITGGTDRCYVIDPIRLTKVFDHAAGYKPLERLFDEGEEKAPVDRAVVVGRSRRSEDARAIAEALEAFIRGHEESKPWDFAKAATRYRRVGDELRLLEEGEHPDDTMYREVIAELEEDLGSDMKWLLAPPFLNGFGVEEAETFARCVNKARRFRCSSAAALIAVLAT